MNEWRKRKSISYAWDNLIDAVGRMAITENKRNEQYQYREFDSILSKMAHESRYQRMEFVRKISSAVEHAIFQNENSRITLLLSFKEEMVPHHAYVYLQTRNNRDTSEDFVTYKERRMKFLDVYCQGVSIRFSSLHWIVGIASEIPDKDGKSQFIEDFALLDRKDFPETSEEIDELEKILKHYDILQDKQNNSIEALQNKVKRKKNLIKLRKKMKKKKKS